MKRAWLAALALPAAALAQDYQSPVLPGQLGNPTIGAPLGANDPPVTAEVVPRPPAASAPATPLQLTELRRRLIGKPVYGPGSGRIGTVSDIIVGADNRVTNITIQVEEALDPDRANLPVPYAWVGAQLDNPTIVVPWDPGLVAWLTEPGRSMRTQAVAPPPPEERAALENATQAQLEEWRARIDARTRATAKPDSQLRQLQLAYGAAEARLERLREVEPESWPVEQAKLQADMEDLDKTWAEVAEAR